MRQIRMRKIILTLMFAILWTLPAAPGRAADLVADLSKHLVAITTGFTGSDVLLFGAVEGKGDVIIVVRGPSTEIVVRKKGRVGGIWINRQRETYKDVPAYYAVAATKPIAKLIPNSLAQTEQIGADHLRVLDQSGKVVNPANPFFQALIRNKRRQGLFPKPVSQVAFLGRQLFRTTVYFPANVPTGTYSVRVLLVRNEQIVGAQTIPLQVGKVGVSAEVFDFAHDFSIWYGLIAILVAGLAGWGASQVFRGR